MLNIKSISASVSAHISNFINKYFKYLILFLSLFSEIFISSAFANSNNITTLAFQHCENDICKDVDKSIFIKKFTVGETIPMRIIIKNPENAPIFSVQSWIKYNSSIFSITGLNDGESDFDLAAPGEFKAVNSKGEIRIGRATTGSALTQKKVIVADFSVKIKKNPNLSTFQFIDFKENAIGKTAVVTIQNNIPANIVEKKPKNLVFKNLKSSASSIKVTNNQQSISVINSDNNNYKDVKINLESKNSNNSNSVEDDEATVTSLPRPTGFRTRTFENGTIEMIWELNQDSKIKGYYLYYSTTSGTYMHRRDMGKTNMYRFDKNFFKKDRKIFFAVQAYATNGTVSDFSDETFVITGNSGTSSHPFFEDIFPDAQKVGEDVEKNKAYYADPNININADLNNKVQKNTIITGDRNIQSGLNMNIVLILMGIFMFMISGIYMIFRKEEV